MVLYARKRFRENGTPERSGAEERDDRAWCSVASQHSAMVGDGDALFVIGERVEDQFSSRVLRCGIDDRARQREAPALAVDGAVYGGERHVPTGAASALPDSEANDLETGQRRIFAEVLLAGGSWADHCRLTSNRADAPTVPCHDVAEARGSFGSLGLPKSAHLAHAMSFEMEFSGKFVEDDLASLRRVSRSRWHWLWFGATYFETFLLLGFLTAATIMSLWNRRRTGWSDLGFMWGVVAIGVTWNWLRTPRRRRKDLARANANMPDTICVDGMALLMRRGDGESSTMPWGQFTRWRQHRRVIVLDRSGGRAPVAFSTSGLSDVECERLRNLLRSHIPQSDSQ